MEGALILVTANICVRPLSHLFHDLYKVINLRNVRRNFGEKTPAPLGMVSGINEGTVARGFSRDKPSYRGPQDQYEGPNYPAGRISPGIPCGNHTAGGLPRKDLLNVTASGRKAFSTTSRGEG